MSIGSNPGVSNGKEKRQQANEFKKEALRSSNRVLLGVIGGIAEYFNAPACPYNMVGVHNRGRAICRCGCVYPVPTVITILAAAYAIAYLLMTEAPAK
jgi:phage shock protein PspC (stress-responsive transcriptional regulator)